MKSVLGAVGALGGVGLALWAVSGGGTTTGPAAAKTVRPSALAGQWYEGTPTRLAAETDRLLSAASGKPLPAGRPAYLIQPHAGYRYSGRAAAEGLKSLRPFTCNRVIILAPSHTMAFRGASVPDFTHYATPLGEVPVDREICAALLKQEGIRTVAEAHSREHSIEIQLPLLQWAFGDHPPADAFRETDTVAATFKIVPVLFGQCTDEELKAIAAALMPHVGPRTLVLASSDFTHYGRSFGYLPFETDIKQNLAKLDGGAVERILAKDAAAFEKYVADTGATICGRSPIAVMLRMLPPGAAGRQLAYYTSGDTTGVWSQSVSYVSLVFCVPENQPAGAWQGGDLYAFTAQVFGEED